MTECERLKRGPFFTGQMSHMPSGAALLKSEYCYGDKTLCARYQVAGMLVPRNLLLKDTRRGAELRAGR